MEMPKQVVTTLKMVQVFDAVTIPFVGQFIDANGELKANCPMKLAATAMLDDLAR